MLRDLTATAPRLHVRDDRETPLCTRRDARQMKVIWGKEEAGYFLREGWTGRIRLKGRVKLASGSGRILRMIAIRVRYRVPSRMLPKISCCGWALNHQSR